MAVYFIRAETTGRVKIGWSNNPEKRLRGLQTGSAERLSLLRLTPGGVAEEAAFHKLFDHLWVDGEWFNYCDEMLTAQVEVTTENVIPISRKDDAARDEFNERARRCVVRRMFPNSDVRVKQLAHALGKSEDTAERLVRGEAQLSAVDVYSLMRLFGPSFIAEIYPEAAILTPRDRKALEVGRRALELAEQVA